MLSLEPGLKNVARPSSDPIVVVQPTYPPLVGELAPGASLLPVFTESEAIAPLNNYINKDTPYWASNSANSIISTFSTLYASTLNATYANIGYLNVSSIQAITEAVSTLYASTVTTTEISIDGQILNADSDQLFLNGIPLATTADLSTIQDWSVYPAFSTVVCLGTDIIGVRNISSAQGTFSSITANSSEITESYVSTLGADSVSSDRAVISQLQTSSITANNVSSIVTTANEFGGYEYLVINGTNVGAITTDPTATSLLYNGVALASGSSVGSNWYLYPAQTAVDFNSKLLSSVTAIQVPNSGAGGPDLTITTGGAGSGFLRVVGNADIGGSLTTDSFITQNHISASGNNFFGNTVIIGDGGIAGIPADLEINGSDLLGAGSALTVNGGTTLDGGTYHGASIGCLPVAGINTNRIDVLPVGIDIESATFLTMNILGATNLVAGGAVAVGAGSYVTLEHGAGAGSNGIFVQNAARNSNAKMIFAFGGDISGALFNNQTVSEVNTNTLAVGRSAGALTPGLGGLAVGIGAGANSLAPNATAIGNLTMNTGSEAGSVAVGREAGYGALGANSIAIGYKASFAGGSLVSTIVMNATGAPLNPVNENALYIAPIRPMATSNIMCYNTATKEVSYTNTLSTLSVSSLTADYITTTFLNDLTLAFDGNGNIKMGDQTTGDFPIGAYAIALGAGAGNSAGSSGQADNAIAIGRDSGNESQGTDAIAIGQNSGSGTQGTNAVSIGRSAGQSGQGSNSVAVGYQASQVGSGFDTVAIGNSAGKTSIAQGSIAIGANAGLLNLGSNAIAIGKNAVTVGTGVSAGGIVLNATGVALNPAQTSSLYVKPVRLVQTSNAYQMSPMLYNATTSEVTYGSFFFTAVRVTAPTTISLLTTLRGRTYIATSAGAQTLTVTNSLTANDTGFYVVIVNGNATGGGDITISGATGNTIVHNKTATNNGGQVHLYWTGSALQAF